MRAPIALLMCLAAPAAALAQASRVPEPKIEHLVIQDDAVRIEELRVRGQTQRVTVKPRHAAEYEIIPATGGRDPSVGRGGNKDASGQRVWNILSF
jgi:hypothetical protein